jgi:hypothetical protein
MTDGYSAARLSGKGPITSVLNLVGVAACGLALMGPLLAWGAAAQIETRTEAQAYQIRAYRQGTPDAPVLLPRRRIVQYLSLNLYEIVTVRPAHLRSEAP